MAAGLLAFAVRWHGRLPALVGLAVLWVPAAPLMLHSTLTYPGYAAGLVAACGALALAAAVLDGGRSSPRLIAGLGAAGGLAAWMHPFFLLSVVPPLVAVAWRHRREASRVGALAGGGAAALVLPLVANVRNGFASFAPARTFADVSYAERLRGILGDLFARAAGARWHDNARACRDGPWTCDDLVDRAANGLDDRWVLDRLGPVQSMLLLALLFIATLVVLRRGSRLGRACAAGLLCAPFAMAALPQSAYTRDGRYASMVMPLAAVVLAQAAHQVLRREAARAIVTAAVVAWVVLAVAVPFAVRLPPHRVDPDADLAPLTAVLRDNGITEVRADYWVAYRLAYSSREEFMASPLSPVKFDRYESPVRRAEAAGRAALVIQRYQPVPARHPPRLVEVGPYLVFLPDGRPGLLGVAAGGAERSAPG